jgi:hypothetical protein
MVIFPKMARMPSLDPQVCFKYAVVFGGFSAMFSVLFWFSG